MMKYLTYFFSIVNLFIGIVLIAISLGQTGLQQTQITLFTVSVFFWCIVSNGIIIDYKETNRPYRSSMVWLILCSLFSFEYHIYFTDYQALNLGSCFALLIALVNFTMLSAKD